MMSVILDKLRARIRPADDHEKIFTAIHDRNEWGSDESRSGPGSTRERAATFAGDIIEVLRAIDTRTLNVSMSLCWP